MELIYGKKNIKYEEYYYSSADDSNISDSEFGDSKDEDLICDNVKKFIKLYAKKIKIFSFRFYSTSQLNLRKSG